MTDAAYNRMVTRIQGSEGLRLKPYTDTVGRLTIGYGRNLTDSGISQEEALDLLTHDIEEAESDLANLWSWSSDVDDVRLGVLVEMCFNLGATRLGGFTKFATAMAAKDYGLASREMLNSQWASQVGQRANRLSAILLSGLDGTA